MSYPSDAQRIAMLAAERELSAIESMCEHGPLSDVARGRIAEALHTIREALRVAEKWWAA